MARWWSNVVVLEPDVGKAFRGFAAVNEALRSLLEMSEAWSSFRHGSMARCSSPYGIPDTFQRFFLEGGTVAWPSGADVAPETLYERAKSHQAA